MYKSKKLDILVQQRAVQLFQKLNKAEKPEWIAILSSTLKQTALESWKKGFVRGRKVGSLFPFWRR